VRSVDTYVRALDAELRDQPRRVRRAEAVGLREHLEELPPGALDQLEPPDVYAHEYRAHRDLRTRRVIGALRRTSVVARIAIVVAVVALVAAVTVPPWVAHYQPVSVNVYLTSPGSVPQHTEHNDLVLSYRDNARIVLGMDVRNSGRYDATLTGYDDGPLLGVLKFAAIRVPRSEQDCCVWEAARPVRFPLRIPAHSTVMLMLELRMTNCEYYGSVGGTDGGVDSVGYSDVRFPMKTLGVHHTVVAPLGDQIFIDVPGPLTPTCPRNRPSQP
jgi:hypothetical protein